MNEPAYALPYLQQDTDRHGNIRFYIRMTGKPRIRIKGNPETEAFRAQYWKLRKELGTNDPSAIPIRQRDPYPVRVENAAERVYEGARKRSYGREIPFALGREDALQVLRKQKHVCAVSGLKFVTERAEDALPGSRNGFAPSLDRIDCAKGYEPDNVRWVLQAVNIALADWGEDQLLKIAKAIVEKRSRSSVPPSPAP